MRALLRWQADEDGVARAWALPLAIFGWGTVAVLWEPRHRARPAVGQPDAGSAGAARVRSLCAVWVAAWLDRRARERGAGLLAVALAAACFVVAMVVPTAVTTLGISLGQSGAKHSTAVRRPGWACSGPARVSRRPSSGCAGR